MYTGIWREHVTYNKGDIVFATRNEAYYICSIDHLSDNLTYPTEEDIYWVMINNEFLHSKTRHSPLRADGAGILFSPFQYKTEGMNRPNRTKVSLESLEEQPTITIPIMRQPQDPEETRQRRSLKRKLRKEEEDIREFKRQKANESVEDLREKLLLLDVDVATKSFIIDKYDNIQTMSGSDYSKGVNWLKTVSSIPYGKYKQMKVSVDDSPKKIEAFFKKVKATLDKSIYGLEDVKQEILEFVARKISNPHGKGEVLALCGSAGCGKTRLLKSLAEALDLPFFQINCGGLNDVSIITGHSETYVGSKPGKIVEILQNAQYMNPIIYLDEIDKLGDRKSQEINGILTHLLDEEQNNTFQDNYLSNVPIDLSKVLFVIAFNDLSKVDSIVSDRMKIVYIDKPSLEDKITICTEKLVPEIVSNTNEKLNINFNREIVEYIVLTKCEKEVGVRGLRKTIEKVVNRLNYDVMTRSVPGNLKETVNIKQDGEEGDSSHTTVYNITKTYVDTVINKSKELDTSYLSMYI